MKKIILIGRSECGKTTLTQALKGEKIHYHKTQYVNIFDVIIDTPGEYAETKQLSGALAVYGCEADIIGLLMSAIEPFSLYPPNVVSVSNREVVGVVTKCDHWAANPELAAAEFFHNDPGIRQTAPKERPYPIFVASEQRLDVSG